jgi:hypothetical protein
MGRFHCEITSLLGISDVETAHHRMVTCSSRLETVHSNNILHACTRLAIQISSASGTKEANLTATVAQAHVGNGWDSVT